MLTGDKLETAENIGESCKLINSREMLIHKLSTVKDVEAFCSYESLEDNNKRALKGQQRAVLVEASALSLITNDHYKKKFFVAISKTCEAVICCRVSPS
jgi:magnesium-transporting ATPase (P-type)